MHAPPAGLVESNVLSCGAIAMNLLLTGHGSTYLHICTVESVYLCSISYAVDSAEFHANNVATQVLVVEGLGGQPQA